MKNYQLTLHTTSLFDLLKDIKNFSAVEAVRYEISDPRGVFDEWMWSVDLATEDWFNPSLLISLAYLCDRNHILQRADYREFKLKILLSQQFRFSGKRSENEDRNLVLAHIK